MGHSMSDQTATRKVVAVPSQILFKVCLLYMHVLRMTEPLKGPQIWGGKTPKRDSYGGFYKPISFHLCGINQCFFEHYHLFILCQYFRSPSLINMKILRIKQGVVAFFSHLKNYIWTIARSNMKMYMEIQRQFQTKNTGCSYVQNLFDLYSV